jgi:hypothetical protein
MGTKMQPELLSSKVQGRLQLQQTFLPLAPFIMMLEALRPKHGGGSARDNDSKEAIFQRADD